MLLKQNTDLAYFGAAAKINDDLNGVLTSNPKIGSPAYTAGLDKGDILTSINNSPFPNGQSFDAFIKTQKVGDTLTIAFDRYEVKKNVAVVLQSDPSYTISLMKKKAKLLLKKYFKKGSVVK